MDVWSWWLMALNGWQRIYELNLLSTKPASVISGPKLPLWNTISDWWRGMPLWWAWPQRRIILLRQYPLMLIQYHANGQRVPMVQPVTVPCCSKKLGTSFSIVFGWCCNLIAERIAATIVIASNHLGSWQAQPWHHDYYGTVYVRKKYSGGKLNFLLFSEAALLLFQREWLAVALSQRLMRGARHNLFRSNLMSSWRPRIYKGFNLVIYDKYVRSL